MLNIFTSTLLLKVIWCSCDYQTFDQSQLNTSSFYGEQSYTRGDLYAFGIWIMYAPVRLNYYYNVSRIPFDPNITQSQDDGYHILNYQSNGVIQTILRMPRTNVTDYSVPVGLSIIQWTQASILEYTFPLTSPFVEGSWIFIYFCFQYSTNKYNFIVYNTLDTTFKSVQVTNQKLKPQTTNAKLEYGGGGQYKMGTLTFNFNIFPGRISKASIMDNPTQFTTKQKTAFVTYINKCFIPSPCTTQQQIKVFEGVYSQKNFTFTDYKYDIPGNRYQIDFWIKRNSYFQIQNPEFILSYGSMLKYQTQIRQIMLHCKPFKEYMAFLIEFDGYYYYPTDIASYNTTLYAISGSYFSLTLEQLSQWNFMRFDFYRQQYRSYFTISVYSSFNNSYFQFEMMGVQWLYEFSNFHTHLSLMSYYLEEDPSLVGVFQGQIANLKISYCNTQAPDFTVTLNLNCHAQCQTCNGPTKWDCLTCYSNQNRLFLKEKNMCICIIGYQEQLTSDICQQHLIQISKQSNQIQGSLVCKRGYFEVWNNSIFLDCLPCPPLLDCLDCFLNSQNWYQNPICSQYYSSNDGIFYTLQQKAISDYFTIDYEYMRIYQCEGCSSQDLCNGNRYKSNGKCLMCSNNCQICNQDQCQKCENNYYLIDGYCEKCNQECQSCNIIKNFLQCTSCPDQYALYNGDCFQCGNYCQNCEVRFTKANKQYQKCLKCYYDTFPSLDGENCYKNPDQWCISPFQYLKQNHSVTTMIYDFEPQLPDFIFNGCFYCTLYNVLNITDDTFSCFSSSNIFALSKGCSFQVIFYTESICLMGQQITPPFTLEKKQFKYYGMGLCFHELTNCLLCLIAGTTSPNICLLCENGYYNDYYTSFCKPCPFQCDSCKQTDVSQVYKLMEFPLFNFLYSLELQDFLETTQDPDKSHIYIICDSCIDGYTFYEGQCIPNCPSNCKECQIINNQNICISCLQLNEYSYFTIQEGKCIECPTNCKLCKQRTLDQKQQFNPYFNNQNYDLFSNLCIQPFDDSLFYDQDQKQFINCNNCYKQVDFDINILCDNAQQTDNFNIKLEQLFNTNENNYFNNIETDDYYLYLNQEYVKQINYKFIFQQNSICQLNSDTYFTSILQQNVFNLLYLNFIIEGNNSTLMINGQITLSNFTSITITNLNIVNGGIITNNIKDYSINIENITISSLNQLNLNTFYFNNVTSVQMKYITVSDMIYNNSSILAINNVLLNSKIVLQNWIIQLSQFNATAIIQLNVQQLNLVFQSIFIFKNTIISSQLLQLPINNIPYLNNLTIIDNSIINSTGLFQFTNELQISQFFIINSKIINSIIIKTQAGLVFSNSQFNNLLLFGNTTLISADNFLQDSEIALNKIDFFDILYEEKQALLSAFNSEEYQISVYLKELKLQQVSLNPIFFNQNFQESIEQSIFFLDCQNITLDNLSIKRGLGFPEFTLYGAKYVTFSNTFITMDDSFYFQSLNTNSDCETSKNTGLYKKFMILYNVQVVKISFITTFRIILFDSVFIDFQQSIDLNQPTIEITHSNFSSNIIHLVTSQSTGSLLKISSLKDLSVYFYNNTYRQNLLTIQEDINVNTQGLLFNIGGNFTRILSSIFEQNMIINGQSSIYLIESNEVTIENSLFKNNSIFQYQTIKQFLVWGFDIKIYQEDLEKLFPVASHGGNGNLNSNNITIINSLMDNSYSFQGAALDITLQENGILFISNSSFTNLGVDMSGGCFFVQSNSNNLRIDISESTFSQISARQLGSIIYLETSTTVTIINYINSNFSNIFALQGPLINILTSNQGNPQFTLKNCLFSNQNSKFFNFINQMSQITTTDLTTITQYFSLVYFIDGMVKIMNLTIIEYPFIPLFYFQNSVYLQDITVLNNMFTRPLFIFNKNVNPLTIEIVNLKIINCTLESNFDQQLQVISKSQQTLNPSCIQFDIPEAIELAEYSSSNQNQIDLLEFTSQLEVNGVMLFENFQEDDQIYMKQIQIQINCQKCQYGVLGFLNLQSPLIKINNIIISNSQCGIYGCLHFASVIGRLLETVTQTRTTILIQKLYCSNNKANYGGCLYLKNSQITIRESRIIKNSANQGGAIYIEGKSSILDAENLFIINNTAQKGSGLYSTDSFYYTDKGILFSDNSGATLVKQPQNIQIEFFKDQILIPTITQRKQQNITYKILTKNEIETILYVPTGIEIYKYRIFSQKYNQYRNDQQILRIYALTDTLEIYNLTGTYCNCWVVDKSGKKYTNFTNKDTFYFNQSSYIFDDLILYISQDTNLQFWLKFWCNSIFIPVIEDGQTISFHQNYSLLVKIKPYKCQLGEYHVSESDYCHQCQTELQQYSVTQNSTFCSIKNDQIISEITASQVKLNSGYWKYKLTSTTFDLCLNNKDNCIGGWKYGNDLCLQGYIGALCEQCDYYNIMGNGEYEHKDRFECILCEQSSVTQSTLSLLFLLFIFLILLLIFNSLSYNQVTQNKIEQFSNYKQKTKLINKLNEAILGQDIQILIQYFQILSLAIELNQVYPLWVELIIDILGNPFQFMKVLNICRLLDSQLNVLYLEFVQNLVCIILFMIIYLFLQFLRILWRQEQIKFFKNLNFIFFFYFYFVISFSRSILKLISVRQIQNEPWIYQNIAYQFNLKTHLIAAFACFLPLLIFFGGIIPLLMMRYLTNWNKNNAIDKLGLWFTALKKYKLYPIKIMVLVANSISVITVDGTVALRAFFSFVVLLIYYTFTNFKPTYINQKQNNFEQSLLIINMFIFVLSAFQKELEIEIYQKFLLFAIRILFTLSCLIIIWKIFNNKFYAFILIKKKIIRQLVKMFPTFSNSFFYKYTEQAEQEHKRRIEKLKQYILTEGFQQVKTREIQKYNFKNLKSEIQI